MLQSMASRCCGRGTLSWTGAGMFCTGDKQIPTTSSNGFKSEKLPSSTLERRGRTKQKHLPHRQLPDSVTTQPSSCPADQSIERNVKADKSIERNVKADQSKDIDNKHFQNTKEHKNMDKSELLSTKLIHAKNCSNDSAEIIGSMRIHDKALSRHIYSYYKGNLFKKRKMSYQRDKAYCAWKFGSPLIFDMSFTQTPNLDRSLAPELLKCYHANLSHPEPFYFYFTDLARDSESERDVNAIFSEEDLVSLYSGSFLDLFPRERLVYLTPYARETFEHGRADDHVFIVGGLVDTFDEDLRSLVRAKELGIRTASLPLHHVGSPKNIYRKALPLDIVVRILLEIQLTGRRDNIYKLVPKQYFWDDPKTDMGHNYRSQSKGDNFRLDSMDLEREHGETFPDNALRNERKGRNSRRKTDIFTFRNLKEKNNKGR